MGQYLIVKTQQNLAQQNIEDACEEKQLKNQQIFHNKIRIKLKTLCWETMKTETINTF